MLSGALRDAGYGGPAFVEVYSDMYQALDDLFESTALCRERMG